MCLGVWLIILFLCSPEEWEHFHYVDMELGVTALSAFLLGLTQKLGPNRWPPISVT